MSIYGPVLFEGRGGLDLELIAGEELLVSHVWKDGQHRTNVRLRAEQIGALIDALEAARANIVEARPHPGPRPTPVVERRCRVCGCTDSTPCWPTCWWVGADLCSMCATTAPTVASGEAPR